MEIKKLGQPKKLDKDLKKPHQIRYTDAEWEQVTENASKAGLKVSDFVRQRTLMK